MPSYMQAAWFLKLQKIVDAQGQQALVAKSLGVSKGLLSQVLSGKWAKSTVAIEKAVNALRIEPGLFRIERDYMSAPWFKALHEFAKANGLKKTGAELGYSSTTISQVLNGKYPAASLKPVEEAARSAFIDTINCPMFKEPISIAHHRRLSAVFVPNLPSYSARRQAYDQCCRCTKREAGLAIMDGLDEDQAWIPQERWHTMPKQLKAIQPTRIIYVDKVSDWEREQEAKRGGQ